MNVSKNVPFLRSVVLTLVSLVCTLNLFAKDINSDADWASVTATDEVYVKCNTTIPSDITCKSLYLNNQGNTLNCANHKITVLGKLSINGYGAKITNANLDVSGDLELLSQNSSISGTLVKVGGNITINGYEAKINANVECAGSLSMSNQNTKITGSINIGKDITISGYSAGVGGNVVCGGDFTMTSQNSYIQGDVSVKGDINMSGYSSSISGSATAGGSINTSNNSNISGSQSQNDPNGGSATSGETPSGEEPSGDEPVEEIYTLVWRNNNDVKSESIDCYQTLVAKAWGGYSGFLIKASDGHYLTHSEYNSKGLKTENCKEVGECMSLDDGVNREYAKIMLNSQNGSSEKTYYFGLKGLKITMYESAPNCGIEVPDIYSGNSTVCKESTISDLLNLSGAKSEGWEYTDGSEVDFTNLIIGKSIQYFAVDDKNVKSTSNTVKIIDKPSISDIDPIVFCSDDGAYNLQNLLDKVQNNEGSNPSTAITFNGSSVSGNYTFSNAGTLKITSTNGCSNGTPTTKDIPVTIGCTPHITLSNSDNIETCNGNSIVLPNVTVDDGSTAQWKIKKSGSSTWTNFFASTVLDMSYNGATLRAEATNAQGTGKSTEITLTVNSDAPGFTYTKSPNQTTLSQSLGGTPASVTYTLKKDNECNNDPISISINNSSDFEISDNTVKLKSGKGVGTYTTTVTFTQAGETKTDKVTVEVVEWPKTFILKKICGGTESDYPVTTDENGKLNIQLHSDDNCEYINEGTIECTEFTLTTSASDHFSGKFVNKGTIKADKIYYGTSSKKLGGSDAVYFDCGGTFIANDLEMNFNTITTSLKGTFLINNSFYIAPAQGQNFEISKCTEIKTYSTDINVSGGSMEISIHGHVNTEYFDVNIPNITSYEDAIITVGHLEESNLNLVISESSLLNLCTNPTKGAPDNIGYIYGTVMYLSDESTGWVDDITPITEGDLNHNDNSSAYWTTKNKYGEPIAKEVIPAYKTYQDCIDEKPDASLLGYDDDPFLPKDKEIRNIYNCNPCSKDFEDTQIEIREIHGKRFRLINGELIYCENDN